MKINLNRILILLILFSTLASCENNLEVAMPQGPKGDKGDKGDPGSSAFDLWKVHYGKDPNISITEFFNSLKGKDGKDGAVPVIGENDNWWISGIDTGISARGKNGVNPVIGTNGNWFIEGKDTGVPSRGQDGFIPYINNGIWWIGDNDTGVPARGQDGKVGKTPVIKIGDSPNYYWVIDGITTNVSAKGVNGKDGNDGKDGYTPVIGTNGNWWIDGKDSGQPSAVIPEVGTNNNWWIGGKDTGKPSKGDKGSDGVKGDPGVDGKSAYDLWKNAVNDDSMTNKDGSKYTGGNSWADFLKWLQGGDVSVLHQYWLSKGNTGDINAFLETLFDCHCDGISIIVLAQNECIEMLPNGTLNKTYNATLKLGGVAGTTFHVTGPGINMNGTIATGQTEASFTIPRTSTDQSLLINCTIPGAAEQVSKTANIPSLKYIKLEAGTPVTVTKVVGEEKDIVSISFATAPDELTIGTTSVYTSGSGVVGGSGWSVSNAGKTFTKTYDRLATAQEFDVKVTSLIGECTILDNLFSIAQLTPVVANLSTFAINGECDLSLNVTGTPGMTVSASFGSPATSVNFTETSAGTYTTSAIPRTYTASTVTVTSSKAGAGTSVQTINVNGSNLLSAPFTVVWTDLATVTPRVPVTGSTITNYPYVEGSFTNQLNKSINIVVSRPATMTNERFPWIEGNATAGTNTQTITLTAAGTPGATRAVIFHRDVTPTFAAGSYAVTASTLSQCVDYRVATKTINNQRDFSFRMSRTTNPGSLPGYGSGGSQPNDPSYTLPTVEAGYTIFEVIVTDAAPNSYVQFLLDTTEGVRSVWGSSKKTDSNGTLKILVKMKDADLTRANGGIGEFKFFNSALSSTPTFTKQFTFTAPN